MDSEDIKSLYPFIKERRYDSKAEERLYDEFVRLVREINKLEIEKQKANQPNQDFFGRIK